MTETARMRLMPATVALARAELTDRAEFARLLSAVVPDEWPPQILADALPLFLEWIEAAPDRVGWYVWYAMMRASREASDMLAGDVGDILIASSGFKGPPQDGTVEIGYSVLPRFQGHGYAAEMVRALIDWAFAQEGVLRIVTPRGPESSTSRPSTTAWFSNGLGQWVSSRLAIRQDNLGRGHNRRPSSDSSPSIKPFNTGSTMRSGHRTTRRPAKPRRAPDSQCALP